MTHDYIREWHDRAVRGAQCQRQLSHRAMHGAPSPPEFIRFLNRVEADIAGDVHAILDDYAVADPKVRAWLTSMPQWVFHFTPTSCSWANAVEGFFATLTRRRLQRGVFRSLVNIQRRSTAVLSASTDRKPKPFVWTSNWSCLCTSSLHL